MLHPSLACFLVCRPGWSLSLWFSQPVGKGYRLSLWGQLYTAPPPFPLQAPASEKNGPCEYLPWFVLAMWEHRGAVSAGL